jgi:hypothetical protein
VAEFRKRTERESSPIGKRDHVVRLESRDSAASLDDSGFPTGGGSPSEWETLAETEMFSKTDISGKERLEAGQLSSPFDSQWNGSYRSDMDPELIDVAKLRRIVHEGRVYDIVSASVVGRKRSIDYLTLARVG